MAQALISHCTCLKILNLSLENLYLDLLLLLRLLLLLLFFLGNRLNELIFILQSGVFNKQFGGDWHAKLSKLQKLSKLILPLGTSIETFFHDCIILSKRPIIELRRRLS